MPSRRRSDLERLPSRELGSSRPPTRLEIVRTGINHLFSGRSNVAAAPRSQTPDSPKTPRLHLGLGNFSSTRIQIPYLSRSNSGASASTPIPAERNETTPNISQRSTQAELRRETRRIPENTVVPSGLPEAHYHPSTRNRFVGVGPEEERLAELAATGRRRRRNKRPSKTRRCAPSIKSRKIRSKILSCFISGLFLTLILTIYLALALSNRNEGQQFHVLFILVILLTTIFFCHSLVRLCMMMINPPTDDHRRRELPSMAGLGGFANPAVPIRVALARDEEAAGIESEATKFPPPAYGLWRESVRVDPNRIFWQRNNEEAPAIPSLPRRNSRQHGEDGGPSTARPPSYMSDDGVDYVIEAEGRSTVPTTEVPLLPHPSERGRMSFLPPHPSERNQASTRYR